MTKEREAKLQELEARQEQAQCVYESLDKLIQLELDDEMGGTLSGKEFCELYQMRKRVMDEIRKLNAQISILRG